MKFRIAVLGAFLCLGAFAQAPATAQTPKNTQTANRVKRPAGASEQAIVGCVDQQNGHYVLRDAKTDQLLNLEAPGDPDNYFARFVGHQVQAKGSESGSTLKVAQIGQVADMCGTGK